MKMFRVAVHTCCWLLVLLTIGIPAFAQSNKGTIVGTVKDPNDALVAGAKVTAINVATADVREVESKEGLLMNAQQHDVIELRDFGDALTETRQLWFSPEYPDYYFSRGPYPGFLECSADRPIDLSSL